MGANGMYRESKPKIRLDGTQLRLIDGDVNTPCEVKLGRGGMYVGCTYITYDALERIYALSKEE